MNSNPSRPDHQGGSRVGSMQQATRNILGIGVGLLAALLMLNAVIGYRQTNALYDQSQRLIHTLNVEKSLDRLLQTVTNAETGQPDTC